MTRCDSLKVRVLTNKVRCCSSWHVSTPWFNRLCVQVQLYNAAGVMIPTSSIAATSSTAWVGGLTYTANFCNDGTLTTDYNPSMCDNGVCKDVWSNLCHTGRIDSYPTMTFTYPCQQGLSKAVIYNFRWVHAHLDCRCLCATSRSKFEACSRRGIVDDTLESARTVLAASLHGWQGKALHVPWTLHC
jgi:hypothetical protein